MRALAISLAVTFAILATALPASPEEWRTKKLFLEDDKTPWKITARELIYDDAAKTYTAKGDVVISKGPQALYAQEATYNSLLGIAEVSGGVRLQMDGDVLTGDRGHFDLERQTGTIENGQLFLRQNNYHIDGQLMEKTGENTYVITRCRVTTCDGERPDWSLTGSKVEVTLEGYGHIHDAALRVREYPVLYLPYLLFPAKTKRQSGLLPPLFGYSERNGAAAELPFFWAISDRMDATFYQRYLSERGYMQGLEYRYLVDKGSSGALLFDILNDKKEKDLADPDDVEVSPFERTNQTRYWFRGKADQKLPLDITVRLDADYVSDADYLREFQKDVTGYNARPDLDSDFGRPLEEKYSPTRRSALRLSRDKGDVSIQAATSYNENPENPPDDETPQQVAAMDFSLLPKKVVRSPLYFGFESGYDYVWREFGDQGQQVSILPQLTLPLWLGPYLEFEPSFAYGLNAQWFEEEGGEKKNRDSQAYDVGARLMTQLERTYGTDWGEVKKVKHRLWPSLSYQYRRQDDRDAESPWFDPLEQTGDLNRLVFALDNFVDARLENREGRVRYSQWVNFQLAQGYSIAEQRDEEGSGEENRPFEPLTAALFLKPYRYLDFYGVTKWDHYDRELTETNLAMSLSMDRSGGRTDIYRVTYQNIEDKGSALNYWLRINLIYGFAAGTSLRRKTDPKSTISNKYWLEYASQCWSVLLGMEREESDTSVLLAFRLRGLGQFGDWQR